MSTLPLPKRRCKRGDRERPGDGADALGGREQAGRRCDPACAGMSQAMCHYGHKGDEGRCEQRHDRDRAYSGTASRLGDRRPGAETERS